MLLNIGVLDPNFMNYSAFMYSLDILFQTKIFLEI